jgi:hypothetical protein
MSAPADLSQECVGLNVRIKTHAGEVYEGTIYAFDRELGIFVLFEPSDLRNRSNFRVFKTDCLTEIVTTGPHVTRLPEPLNADSRLPKINAAKIRESADHTARDRIHKLGTDVTIEAQDIFDALSKTYPCKWDGSSIIILGEVRIEAPYTTDKVRAETGGRPSDASGGKPIESTVERVKKVLEGERRKMKSPAAKKG